MNHTTALLRLASLSLMLGILICSTNTPLKADDVPQSKCTEVCEIVGYRCRVIINLMVTAGEPPYATPACACVRPGGTIIWQNEDPEVPWSVNFPSHNPSQNPIDTPGNISDWDDTWFVLGNAAVQEYHYTATLDGVNVDPHVVVGRHPPLETKDKHKKTKKTQQQAKIDVCP